LNKYDYSITEYIKSNEKVKISCKKHGPFEINVNSHLNGRGYSKCKNNNIKLIRIPYYEFDNIEKILESEI